MLLLAISQTMEPDIAQYLTRMRTTRKDVKIIWVEMVEFFMTETIIS